MKKPLVLIVSAAAGAFLLAGAGAASAHTGLSSLKAGSHSAVLNATSEPSETPEPTETPEAVATAEPTETPEPTSTPETDTDTETNDEVDSEDGTNADDAAPVAAPESSEGDHESGGDSKNND